jgi:hypothetical protein
LRVVSLAGGKPAFERMGPVAGQAIADHRLIDAVLCVGVLAPNEISRQRRLGQIASSAATLATLADP